MIFKIHESKYEIFNYSYATFERSKSINKPYLLFLGGAFQDIRASYKICRELSNNFKVICVEVPGSGNSDPLPESYSFGYLATLLYDLIKKLGIHKTHVIGCSYGSPIAYRFSQKYPEFVDKMILTGVMKEIPIEIRDSVKKSVSLIESGHHEEFDTLLMQLFFNLEKENEITKQKYIRDKFSAVLSKMTMETKIKYAQNTKRLLLSTLSSNPQVNIPVLVMTGEFDNFTSPKYCKRIADMCKNSTVALVNNSDHFFHAQQPKVTNELVREFLLGNDIATVEGHNQSRLIIA